MAALFQLVPLPVPILDFLSPATRPTVAVLMLAPPSGAQPITIDLPQSVVAVALFVAVAALFFAAREVFSQGGIRTVVRSLALVGIVLSAIAIAQDATARGHIYWMWRPIHEGPAPFGPFVNRNHFGTWAIIAVPLYLGYLTAHAAAHRSPASDAPWQSRLRAALDTRGAILLIAGTVVILAVAVSLSRSSMVGLAAALACAGMLARRRIAERALGSSRPAVLVAALGACSALAIWLRVDVAVLTDRFSATGVAAADRLLIWRDTMTVIREFWLTGSGVGTFQTSMAIYQRSSPGVIYNQAHNHYLQVVSEGGLLVALPVALALVTLVRHMIQSLQSDRSGMYWLRMGAASGLCGVAVQSIWETGLTTPANAALAAVAAAIVVHVPVRTGRIR